MPDGGKHSRLVEAAGELPRAFAEPPQDPGPASEEREPDAVAEAFDRGREEGRRLARESFEQQAESLRLQVAETLKRLSELEQDLCREHRARMIELALEAASKIARQRIAEDDPVAARALREALEALPTGEPLRARLHPDDLDALKRELADEVARRQIELLPDETIRRGGCVLQGRLGTVDATLETAMDAVRSAAEGRSEIP